MDEGERIRREERSAVAVAARHHDVTFLRRSFFLPAAAAAAMPCRRCRRRRRLSRLFCFRGKVGRRRSDGDHACLPACRFGVRCALSPPCGARHGERGAQRGDDDDDDDDARHYDGDDDMRARASARRAPARQRAATSRYALRCCHYAIIGALMMPGEAPLLCSALLFCPIRITFTVIRYNLF